MGAVMWWLQFAEELHCNGCHRQSQIKNARGTEKVGSFWKESYIVAEASFNHTFLVGLALIHCKSRQTSVALTGLTSESTMPVALA